MPTPAVVPLAAAALIPAVVFATWPLLARRLLSHRPAAIEPSRAASLSVLIPAGLAAALGQSWPEHAFEVIVVAATQDDPALQVARRAIARAPSRGHALAAGGAMDEPGKVAQLAAALAVSRGEWLVLLDSDARLPDTEWLRRFCAPLAEAGTGLVSGVPVDRVPRSSAAEALAATLEPDLLGCFAMLDAVGRLDVANGSCLGIRRETLRRVRGIEAMRGRLLMDAALARAVRADGGAIRVHGEPVPLEPGTNGWRSVHEQSHRWLAALLRGLPPPIAVGFAWLRSGALLALLLAVTGGGVGCGLGIAAIATRLVAALVLRSALGVRWTPRRAGLQLVVDLVAAFTWIHAALDPRVTWRGRRWRVRRGARVEPLAPCVPPRGSGA